MEFFEFANVATTQEAITKKVISKNLPFYCEEIEAVTDEGQRDLVVYFSHWGRFSIRSEEIMGGIRFSIPDCPNALTLSVTTGYPPHPDKIVIHSTINRTYHDNDFIEGIQSLIKALKSGLEKNFCKEPATPEPQIELMDLR